MLSHVVSRNAADPRLFVMGNDVVRLRRDPLAKQTHAERLTFAALKHEIDAAVDFYVVIEDSPTKKHSCPKDIAEHIFNMPTLPFPELLAVTGLPVLRPRLEPR